MENAADALKIAGYVLLFTMALTVAIFTLSKGKVASEAIVYTKDETNYYTFAEDDTIKRGIATTGTSAGNRIVSWETIVPSIYRYNSENFMIQFLNRSGSKITLNDGVRNWDRLALIDESDTNRPVLAEIIKNLKGVCDDNARFEESLSIDLSGTDDVPEADRTEIRTITYRLK